MVRIWTPHGTDISLGVILERFDADAVIAELEAAAVSGNQRQGQDLLTILDPALDPDQMTLEGLYRISQVARRIEGPAPKRSIYVAAEGKCRRGTEVYIALRQQLEGPVPDQRIFPDVLQACAYLAVPDLSAEFRAWPALHPLLTPH